MKQRPRRLLREISQRTGLNWAKRGSMVVFDEKLMAKLASLEDDLKTASVIEQLLVTSDRRSRLRLS